MNETEQYYCPSCGALQSAFNVHCTRCGQSLCHSEEERRSRIDQLLSSGEPVAAAPLPPGVAASRPPAAGDVPAETERIDAVPPTEKASPFVKGARQFLRPRILIPIGAAAVILVLLFTVAVPLIRSAAMGYQASPEALIEGLNIALQEQDDELFASLMSKNSGESRIRVPESEVTYSVVDLTYGKHSKIALLYLKAERNKEKTSSSLQYPGSSYGDVGPFQLIVVQEEGRWCFQNSNILYYGDYTY
ncbi:MAG: hypothetical protein HFJ79_02135 [Clostridiales bacterium]|jgi:uncharacterized membrane protein YvbJ|nr:hypothetical protein [Clostridiales bacterium]